MPPMDEVEVWIADLAQVPASLHGLLSEPERERAARLRDERSRKLWSASRAVLRELLARRVHTDPAALDFELDAHGKPRLRGSPGQSLRFNVSHSGTLALYALCLDREVGVDVELANRGRSPRTQDLAIARRMLGEQVTARLRALGPDERRGEFLRAWVAHEAAVKCLGVGLGGAARGGLVADWAKTDQVEQPGDATASPAGIWVTPIDLGADAFAALAVEGPPMPVVRRTWRAPGRGRRQAS